MNFYLFSFLILLTVELGLPGFFCRSVCPTGLFLSLASRFSIFKLGYRKGTGCEKSCKSCNQVCWLGVEPKLKLSSPECDLCMRCVSVCPTNRLKPVMKNSLIGAISLFVLISPTIHTYTSTLLQDEDRTIMENRLNLRISKKDYRIHWSVLASNMRRTTPGKAVLVIYFYKPSYRSKLDIRILSDKSLVKSCEIQEPNHPGSVARNSAYSCEFDFSPKQKYSVGIKLNSSEEARFKIRYQP